MADTLDSTGKYVPKDLQITTQPDTVDKNKFLITATGLKIDSPYVFQFQYVFPDGTLSEWSPGYTLNSSTEVVPSAPSAAVPSTSAASIPVTLSTFPANAKRVDVYIINGIFGTGKVAYSFFSAGTTTIAAPAGTYQVQLITVTPSGINGTPTQTFSITVTDPTANLVPDPSVTPSTPTISSVLGAIQLAWNGKTSTGGDQPNGFVAAKVYVGTSSGFTPIDTGNTGANQVDTLNFGNGQNTLNIAVGTLVNGVAMTYNTNYYVKIKTTNGKVAEDSVAVLATGSPAQIGKVGSGDIVSITADQITTGTISSQTVTVGAVGGKRVELRGTGNPIEIYGTGGTSLLSYNASANKLVVTGEGSFTGAVTATSGSFTGDLYASNGLFKVESGQITATSGKIGDWVINSGKLASSSGATPTIELDPLTPQIVIRGTGGQAGYNITLTPVSGINAGSTFSVTPQGYLTSSSGQIGGWTIGPTTLTGGTLTLNSSGTLTSTGSMVGWTGSTIDVTSTLASGKLTTNSAENTIGYFTSTVDTGFSATNNTNKTSITPNGIYVQSTAVNNGVGTGGFSIQNSSGDYDIHLTLTGALDANNLTQRNIKFDHWSVPAQRAKDNAAAIYDIISQNIRPLVIDTEGRMFIGATSYFSTTQTTTPSNSTGANGDLYYSTA